MLIVGVDPGIASCGVALLDSDTRRVRIAKTIRSAPSADTRSRVREVADAVSAVIANGAVALTWEAQDFAIVGQHKAGRTTHRSTQVLRIVGTLDAIALALGLLCCEVSPRTIKRAVTGSSTASKEQVKTAVSRIFTGCPARMSEHAADAVACAWAGALCLRNSGAR